MGLERTGLLGMFLLVSTSMLSVLSIFMPGSPFIRGIMNSKEEVEDFLITTETLKAENIVEDLSFDVANKDQDSSSNGIHIIILMVGIILARFGRNLYVQ